MLKELIKYTPEDHVDRADLLRAKEAMSGVTMYINEMKRRLENLQTLMELQRRIQNWPGIGIVSLGNLLHDSILSAAAPAEKKEVIYTILLERYAPSGGCGGGDVRGGSPIGLAMMRTRAVLHGRRMIICRCRVKRRTEYEYRTDFPLDAVTLCNLKDDKGTLGYPSVAAIVAHAAPILSVAGADMIIIVVVVDARPLGGFHAVRAANTTTVTPRHPPPLPFVLRRHRHCRIALRARAYETAGTR